MDRAPARFLWGAGFFFSVESSLLLTLCIPPSSWGRSASLSGSHTDDFQSNSALPWAKFCLLQEPALASRGENKLGQGVGREREKTFSKVKVAVAAMGTCSEPSQKLRVHLFVGFLGQGAQSPDLQPSGP